MLKDYDLTSYNYYSNRRDMEIISNIVDSLKKILEEDSKQEQPLFLKISDNLIMDIARKVVQEKKKTFLIGITGESASGKTVFVDNTIQACVKDKTEGIYTVIRCDDYYKDTSKELKEAIEKYIVYYNEKRIKEKLGWMSPVEYRLSTLAA